MREMVERVAIAIFCNQAGGEGWPESLADESRNYYREQAAAAVRAMREPTEDQSTAGYQFLLGDSEKHGYGDRTDEQKLERMRGYYRAMIDAALK